MSFPGQTPILSFCADTLPGILDMYKFLSKPRYFAKAVTILDKSATNFSKAISFLQNFFKTFE